jgi:aspartyl-tRNA(Asn)/glutamyl-tRNA(Gln) amidotransferase subunit A
MPPSRIRALAANLQSREVSSEDLTREAFATIAAEEGRVNAFITLTEQEALATARDTDARRAAGETLPLLAGIPCALKDLFCTAGTLTTAGSRILENFVPPYDAEAVSRLRARHAVFVGKTNLDAFGMGSSTEMSIDGPTRHPLDPARVSGGSSGGSVAAVAAGLVPYALGTDTGGSIRQPASFCGVVGLKPTYGRVSRYGVVAYASSFDTVGPVAATVEDAAIVYEAIAGPDPKDSTTLPASVPPVMPTLRDGVRGLRVGVPEEYFGEGVDSGVAATVRQAIATLASLGANVSAVSLPLTDVALAVYIVLSRAEASTNLARYDGIRYGRRVTDTTLEEVYRRSRGEGFNVEVKRRILLGTFALSSGYADRYYRTAAAVRREIAAEYVRMFERVDVLVGPAAPEVAFGLGEKIDDPLRMYAGDVLTVPVNVAGVPALVVPCGTAHGLPVGLQIVAAQGREDHCFRVGAAFEEARGGVT